MYNIYFGMFRRHAPMSLLRIQESPVRYALCIPAQACALQIASEKVRASRVKNISHSSLLVHRNIVHSLQIRQELLKDMWQPTGADVEKIIANDVLARTSVEEVRPIAHDVVEVAQGYDIQVTHNAVAAVRDHILREINFLDRKL